MFNISSLRAKNSKLILLTGENEKGLGHLKYWAPEFLKAKVNFSIVVRNEALLNKVKNEYRTVTVLLAKSALDIEETFTNLPNLKSIFYMSNPANNIHALRFNQYQHIFLGSENSDRDAQVSKVMRVFDELWLTSQASIDKLSPHIDTSALTISKVGKPQLKQLMRVPNKNKEKSVLFIVSSDSYHESDSCYIKEVLSTIPQDFHVDIVIDKSLSNKNPLLSSLTSQLNELNWKLGRDCSLYDVVTNCMLLRNKLIICDLNSYLIDFLATNALICMYVPSHISPNNIFDKKHISFDGIMRFSNTAELKKAFVNYDSFYQKQHQFADYWLGNSYTVNDEFYEALKKL